MVNPPQYSVSSGIQGRTTARSRCIIRIMTLRPATAGFRFPPLIERIPDGQAALTWRGTAAGAGR
ncbi:hypothetical protein LNP74_29545 [Klebsiella pneumoniae subsp. pneumoniae]|nr:hypothetical protein [Klebsiella pneumoniae subsp. pneumoniae]